MPGDCGWPRSASNTNRISSCCPRHLPPDTAGGLAEFAEEVATSEHLAKFRRLSAQTRLMVVLGYLEKVAGDRRVRNAIAIFDRGQLLGRHYKHNLWPDSQRPYRDEPSLMVPGKEIEVFHTRLGRFAILTCYENSFAANWQALRGKVDFVLSPYNCQGDPSYQNIGNAKRRAIPSAWADRTGTVYCGDGRYMMNPGTAGLVGADGKTIAQSRSGTETDRGGRVGNPDGKEESLMSNDVNLSCPIPFGDYATVQLAHGGGGRMIRS